MKYFYVTLLRIRLDACMILKSLSFALVSLQSRVQVLCIATGRMNIHPGCQPVAPSHTFSSDHFIWGRQVLRWHTLAASMKKLSLSLCSASPQRDHICKTTSNTSWWSETKRIPLTFTFCCWLDWCLFAQGSDFLLSLILWLFLLSYVSTPLSEVI